MPLDTDREPLDGAGPVHVVGGALDLASAAEHRRVEAQAIIAAITSATSEPGWLVRDEALRRARFGDIAILVPTRTGLPILEEALDEAQIPYRVESVSLVYGSQEVRDLLALARAIDEPGNEMALVATLRSPAFRLR